MLRYRADATYLVVARGVLSIVPHDSLELSMLPTESTTDVSKVAPTTSMVPKQQVVTAYIHTYIHGRRHHWARARES